MVDLPTHLTAEIETPQDPAKEVRKPTTRRRRRQRQLHVNNPGLLTKWQKNCSPDAIGMLMFACFSLVERELHRIIVAAKTKARHHRPV